MTRCFVFLFVCLFVCLIFLSTCDGALCPLGGPAPALRLDQHTPAAELMCMREKENVGVCECVLVDINGLNVLGVLCAQLTLFISLCYNDVTHSP